MVSAVILSYNRCQEVLYTLDQLKTLSSQLPFELEIIVVDNASADDTAVQVTQLHPDVTLVSKAINNGIAGWNDGFAVASQKYILVLDDDSHIEQGLTEAVSFMDSDPLLGVLALNVTGGPFTTEGVWVNGQDLIGFVGCGAIIRSEVYLKVGGFAEWLYVYGHEWEFGIRVIDAGYSIKYFANSRVVHRASNINRSIKRLLTYSTRNEMGTLYKYFGSNRWKYIALMFLNMLKGFKRHGIKATWYTLVGAFKFYSMRGQIERTPVSEPTQKYFASKYSGTQPFFSFLKKRVKYLPGQA